MSFVNNPTLSFAFATNEFGFGISLNRVGNDIIVENVIPNSIADKLGLKNGQKIIKFNGKKINKVKDSDIENINSKYKSLKITTFDNKQYKLKSEDISLLNSYNQIQETYNQNTKYKVTPYKTEKIILANDIESKHAKYANAYLNYADAIAIENSKLYVDLFKVTDENVKIALEKTKNNEINPYSGVYNSIYRTNKTHDIYGEAFKQFLELSIYNDENINLINRQISEFNELQKKQFAQLAYNTRIIANLYSYANRELSLYLIKHTVNANKTDIWQNELKTENNIYNIKYKELCNLIATYKIEIKKPGPLSNREQITAGIVPNSKWVDDKQIVVLAQEKGYNSNKSGGFARLDTNNHTQYNSLKQLNNYKVQIPFSLIYSLPQGEQQIWSDGTVSRSKEFNSIILLVQKSINCNAKGDINNAIINLNNAFSILEKEGYTATSKHTPSTMKDLYLYRAYLYLKSGNESYLNAICQNIYYALSFYNVLPSSSSLCLYASNLHNNNFLYVNLTAYDQRNLIYEILDDKNISSYTKNEVYKYIISILNTKAGTYMTLPAIASYIEYIYSLDNSDPLFKKLGKNKTQILNSYIATLRGYYAPISKGILIMASGQFNEGCNLIYNGFRELNNLEDERKYASYLIHYSLFILRTYDLNYLNLPKAAKLNDPKIELLESFRNLIDKHDRKFERIRR